MENNQEQNQVDNQQGVDNNVLENGNSHEQLNQQVADSQNQVSANADFNPSDYLGKVSGGKIKSEQELQQILDRYPTISSEYESLKNSISKDYIKPTDDFDRKFIEARQRGINPKDFIELNDIDFSTMDIKDAVRRQLQIENGFTKEEADLYMDEKYKLSITNEDAELDTSVSRQKKLGELALKQDSINAKKFLQNYRSEKLTSPFEQENQMTAQKIKFAEPVVNDLSSKEYKIDIPVSFKINDNEEKASIDYQLSAQEREDVKQAILMHIQNNRSINPTREDIVQMYNSISKGLLANNGKLHNIIAQRAVDAAYEKFVEMNHNPSAKKQRPINGSIKLTPEQELLNKQSELIERIL